MSKDVSKNSSRHVGLDSVRDKRVSGKELTMAEVRFCPNCGSTDVEPDREHTNVIGEFMLNQNKWLCNQCDYRGLMPEGDPDDFDEEFSANVDFEPTKQATVDTDAGKGLLKYFLYISLPITVLYILFKLVF